MITDPAFKNVHLSLNMSKLEDYWNQYFAFQNSNLHNITEVSLQTELDKMKSKKQLFVDSQIVISTILTNLGSTHNFHRQFNESFSGFSKEQVLGMQLYTIMLADNLIWIYQETQHAGHKFPHATYFIPKNFKQEYIDLCEKYNSPIKPFM